MWNGVFNAKALIHYFHSNSTIDTKNISWPGVEFQWLAGKRTIYMCVCVWILEGKSVSEEKETGFRNCKWKRKEGLTNGNPGFDLVALFDVEGRGYEKSSLGFGFYSFFTLYISYNCSLVPQVKKLEPYKRNIQITLSPKVLPTLFLLS